MKEDLFESASENRMKETPEAASEQSREEAPRKNGRKAREPESKAVQDATETDVRGISLAEAILRIGLELKCPKSNIQKDGNSGRQFPYRCVEDILTALAPFREKYGVFLTFSSRPVLVGTFNYIVVDATIRNLRGESLTVSSSAREDAVRPGYWAAQITGSCESYAKKYALQSMFMIDEGKVGAVVDTDAAAAPVRENGHKVPPEEAAPAEAPPRQGSGRKPLAPGQGDWPAITSDAAAWKGTKREFIDKILDKYLITKTNMQLLIELMEAA